MKVGLSGLRNGLLNGALRPSYQTEANVAQSPTLSNAFGGTSTNQDFTSFMDEIFGMIRGLFDENQRMWEDTKAYNTASQKQAFEDQKELAVLQADLQRQLRSSQFQDTVEDLKKAGINPAVYFGANGSPGNYGTVNAGGVAQAHANNPNSDKTSTLVQAVASIMTAIANNKNADSAVLRSIIGAVGNIASSATRSVLAS